MISLLRQLGNQITYKVFKKNFFVISGYKGDSVIYWKIIPTERDFFKVTVSVDGEPLITLPNYRLVQTDKGLKVDAAIHEVKKAKEQGGKPEFIKCYYPFNNLNDEVLPEAEKVYKSLPVKKGK